MVTSVHQATLCLGLLFCLCMSVIQCICPTSACQRASTVLCSQNHRYLDDRKHRRGLQKAHGEGGPNDEEDTEASTSAPSHKHTRSVPRLQPILSQKLLLLFSSAGRFTNRHHVIVERTANTHKTSFVGKVFILMNAFDGDSSFSSGQNDFQGSIPV